jgi:hypothetical protein
MRQACGYGVRDKTSAGRFRSFLRKTAVADFQ